MKLDLKKSDCVLYLNKPDYLEHLRAFLQHPDQLPAPGGMMLPTTLIEEEDGTIIGLNHKRHGLEEVWDQLEPHEQEQCVWHLDILR